MCLFCPMKDLKLILTLMVVGLVAAVALALVMTGWVVARGYNERELQAAPRTLHQMVIESEAAGEPDRSNTLLFGAGLAALAVLGFGGMLVGMGRGTELARQVRLLTRKKKTRLSPYPTIEGGGYSQSDAPHIAPTARLAPLLDDGRGDYPSQRLGDGRRPAPSDYPGER